MSRFDSFKSKAREKLTKKERPIYGLSQKRFHSSHIMLPRQNNSRKIWRYKTSANKVVSLSSGSLILSFGLGYGFLSSALYQNNSLFLQLLTYTDTGGISGIIFLFSGVLFNFFFDPFGLLSSLITGWFLGGVISSFVYKREGGRGPLYSAYLAVSMTVSLIFITSVLTFSNPILFFENDLAGVLLGFGQLLIISVVISIVSIPLAIVSWIGYKLGSYFVKGGR